MAGEVQLVASELARVTENENGHVSGLPNARASISAVGAAAKLPDGAKISLTRILRLGLQGLIGGRHCQRPTQHGHTKLTIAFTHAVNVDPVSLLSNLGKLGHSANGCRAWMVAEHGEYCA